MEQRELEYDRAGDEERRTYERAAQLAASAPVPARLGRVLAGTAGWTDPTLIRSHTFYPRGASSSEARLRYYASQFALVEVDSSYYALPTPVNAERWVERTPADFTFNVKAFSAITQHPVDVLRLPRDLQSELPEGLRARRHVYPKDLPGDIEFELWKRFKQAVEPLHRAHKLGCVLLQFPPWFTATKSNAKFLEVCRARMDGLPLAVEFRHPSWGEAARLPRVITLLRRAEMSFVAVDEPQGTAASMPPVVEVASPKLAVVRFHGRRAETWDVGASVQDKFDYLYDPAELRPWLPRVQQLAQQAEKVHLVFNNCVENRAVLGARDIMALMAGEQAAPAAPAARSA